MIRTFKALALGLLAAISLSFAVHAAEIDKLKADAEKGNPIAQNNLAVLYATGDQVKQDFTEAAKWYRRAAEQGHAIAQHNLGAMYEQGQGVGKDIPTALVWYALAAEQNDAWAQYSLGRLLADNIPQRDVVTAYKWLFIAANSADQDVRPAAAAALKVLTPTLTAKQSSEALLQAKAWKPR